MLILIKKENHTIIMSYTINTSHFSHPWDASHKYSSAMGVVEKEIKIDIFLLHTNDPLYNVILFYISYKSLNDITSNRFVFKTSTVAIHM